MTQFQCYFFETIYANGRAYYGKRINDAIFDTEIEAEKYCNTHVGIQKTKTGYIENDMNYEQIWSEQN